MAVKIRLTRVGKKRQPAYRVVVADSRSPRDGRYIEQIGRYDPTVDPSIVEIDNDRAKYWLSNGAQPSSQVKKLLEISGSLPARPVKDRKIHVVAPAPAPVAEPVAVVEPAVEEAAEPEVAAPEAAPAAAVAVAEVEVDDKVLDMAAEAEPVAEVPGAEPVAEVEGEPVAEAAADSADEEQPS
ncbi:MAG: 30S ribosomal protein S16 [Acidimicrobiia bacterium]